MTDTRISLAESDVLVAMDLASEFETAGMMIAGTAASIKQALELVEGTQMDFALLNVGLQDGASFPLAGRLMALGIPFAFLTSFEKEEIDPAFYHIPCISKPRLTAEIVKSVF